MYFTKVEVDNAKIKKVYVYFDDRGVTELVFKKRAVKADLNSNHKIAITVSKQLQEYFQGKRKEFNCPLNFEGTEFQKRAWQTLRQIPHGKAISYSDQATKMKNKQAARAVGNANGKNPIPIIIPCHRVLHRGGGLGGFSAGLPIKKALLELEGIKFS